MACEGTSALGRFFLCGTDQILVPQVRLSFRQISPTSQLACHWPPSRTNKYPRVQELDSFPKLALVVDFVNRPSWISCRGSSLRRSCSLATASIFDVSSEIIFSGSGTHLDGSANGGTISPTLIFILFPSFPSSVQPSLALEFRRRSL